MSDLQCPTRLLLVIPVEAGREKGLADAVAGDRVASVWTGPTTAAARTGRALAARLGVGVVVRADLRDLAGAGESVAQGAARVSAVVAEIADTHRGEAVVVVGHGRALHAAMPHVEAAPAGGVLELEGDGDGWVVRTRPPTSGT